MSPEEIERINFYIDTGLITASDIVYAAQTLTLMATQGHNPHREIEIILEESPRKDRILAEAKNLEEQWQAFKSDKAQTMIAGENIPLGSVVNLIGDKQVFIARASETITKTIPYGIALQDAQKGETVRIIFSNDQTQTQESSDDKVR